MRNSLYQQLTIQKQVPIPNKNFCNIWRRINFLFEIRLSPREVSAYWYARASRSAGVAPAARSRPLSESVCPVSLRDEGSACPQLARSRSSGRATRASPHELARGYSRSPRPRQLDRDGNTPGTPPTQASKREVGAQVLRVCVREGRRCNYKRKGIIFACIFHYSIRGWNF